MSTLIPDLFIINIHRAKNFSKVLCDTVMVISRDLNRYIEFEISN